MKLSNARPPSWAVCSLSFSLCLLAWQAVHAQEVDDEETVQRDLIRVRQKAEEQLWLRMNVKGHTGVVQALAFTPDSKRLCSAGLDKVVQVWNLDALGRDIKRVYLKERTIRWQVARSLRGSLYAEDINQDDGTLAMGGYGAMGSLGEILLVDPLQGELKQVLNEHRQTVVSLKFSANGDWLASSDVAGQIILWKRGDWKPQTLYDRDAKVYGQARADMIAQKPKLRPLAITGNSHLVMPLLVSREGDTRLQWKLGMVNLNNRQDFKVLNTVHYGLITALAASSNGRKFASADIEGNIYVWDVGQATGRALPVKKIANSLAFSSDGQTLLVGTVRSPADNGSQLQVWNTNTFTQIRSRALVDHVAACVVSPDGKRIAYSGGKDNEVYVESLDNSDRVSELKGTGRRILKAAFSAKDPLYRVAFGTTLRNRGVNDLAELDETFDTQRLDLGTGVALNQDDWIKPSFGAGNWQASIQKDGSLQLYQNNAPRGVIQLDRRREGNIRCFCWVPDDKGQPFAVAIGTDIQNSIFVYRLANQGPCTLLRHFRGHNDVVMSVGISRDVRYLVSASSDGTVRIWSLDRLHLGRDAASSWGASMSVKNGKLVVGEAHEAGPLFRKGMRTGDEISVIRWYDDKLEVLEEKRPEEMLKRLNDLPWTAQVGFEFTRNGVERPAFQALPAWEQLSSLFAASDREWAYWTPEGYYDASFNGYTMFGWQVNRGVDKLPSFYRADQYQKTLERPDVLENLLTGGSVPEAFRRAQEQPPAEPEKVLIQHVAVTPTIKILSPRTGDTLQQDLATVRASVQLPGEGKMVSAKVFANGVVAADHQVVEQKDIPGGKEFVFEWKASVPSDMQNLIQVVVGTDAPTAAFNDVVVNRTVAKPPEQPKLYLLSVGVNDYQDENIQPLNYSVADALSVSQKLQDRASPIYDVNAPVVLTNERVTRVAWQTSFAEMSKKLKDQVKPNDVLVLFLAGHGFVDEKTKKYYYASYDLSIDDFAEGKFNSCISWNDFELLADIPCRKVAFLDTCHSGAIQPLQQRNLKAAVRDFQEDVVFTVTASTGSERSAENPAWGHGAFTKCLLEALDGKADTSNDGVITLTEVIDYVKTSVPELTNDGQHPTAAPDELFPYITLGLTKSAKAAASATGQ